MYVADRRDDPQIARRRRLLFVSQPTTEGVAVCVAGLAAVAVKDGIDVTVACPATGELPKWAAEVGATWTALNMARSPSLSDVPALLTIRRLLAHCDLAHLHSSKAGALGRLAALTMSPSRRPPVVFSPHGWSWLAGGHLAPAYRAFELATSGVADVIVAVSEEEASLGKSALRGRARLRVLPNGVDLVRFHPEGPTASRCPGPLVVCVGRLTAQKGQDLAVRMLAAMTTRQARLRLVGPGSEKESASVRSLAAELGVSERVELTGRAQDVAPVLRAADVVVQPSRWEGMSLSLLEAMACGAAVVASAVAGTAILSDGAGVLVPPGDAKAMALAVDALLVDPARRRALGVAARQRAEKDADLTRSRAAHLALWRELGL
jgi:glycosyltransferase involved in cell wall biosynthesis